MDSRPRVRVCAPSKARELREYSMSEMIKNKATRIKLFSFGTPQMRAFHMSWFAFFLCFFAWFGIAPLMAVDVYV